MAVKNFDVAVEEYDNVTVEDDKILEFTLPVWTVDEDTEELVDAGTRVYETYLPTPTQIALYAGALGSGTTSGQMAGVHRFVSANFISSTASEIFNRLEDRRDPIGLVTLQKIIEWIIEETTANPSIGSATSATSPRKNGSASTASSRPKGQTRSRGPRAGS